LHEARTGGYLISRTEITLGEWILFLEALPLPERSRYLPATRNRQWGVELLQLADGQWQLALVLNNERRTARGGEPLVIPERSRRREQDWRRFPVTAISTVEAEAYMTWLGGTGRVPGARFCSEREWERAARGADNRIYPHGDRLEPEDAAFDETYGREPRAFGPDEVDAHPTSESPFGVLGMTGSVFEWTRSTAAQDAFVFRSGAWYYDHTSVRVDNRFMAEPNTRDHAVGLRVCADFTVQ
jgi:formylglycine-generating enzyme required for sulfatase activity